MKNGDRTNDGDPRERPTRQSQKKEEHEKSEGNVKSAEVGDAVNFQSQFLIIGNIHHHIY